MSVSDYIGRVVDILAFQGPNSATVELAQTLAAPGSSGEICTGIQKLAQRVLITLLTKLNSQTYWPAEGTVLITAFENGQIQTESDMLSYFTLAEQQLEQQMLAAQTGSEPLDEQYKSLTLNTITIGPGILQFSVTLTSQAGTTATYIVPLGISL